MSEAWVARYNRTTSRNESANAIALDPTGNVYVVGTNSGGVSDSDITTVKYDAGGNQLWATSYSQTPDSIDHGLLIAAGSSDSVYVAGQSRGATGYYYDMILIKYDSAGNRLWVSIFNGPGNMDDRPKGLIVGASGSVYVTIESDGDIVTVKYGSLGNLLWSARYSGAGNRVDQPNAIALDVAENVYVTGGSDGDMITIKYDSNGNQLWATHYNGPSAGADIANHLTIDPAGNVYVVGESYGTGTVYDFVTIKYDVVGNQLWAVRYDGPDHRLDEANFVAVDGSGYVYVTGNSYYQEVDRSGPEIVTIKYDSNGSQLWQNRYRAAGTSANGVSGLAIDAIGNVYISGFSFGEDESQSILLNMIPPAIFYRKSFTMMEAA